MGMLEGAKDAGKDVAGFAFTRALETVFAPGKSQTPKALGGEPLGAEARATGSVNPSNPGFRDAPDAFFGKKNDADFSGGQVVSNAPGFSLDSLSGLPSWVYWVGGGLLVVLGLKFLVPKRRKG